MGVVLYLLLNVSIYWHWGHNLDSQSDDSSDDSSDDCGARLHKCKYIQKRPFCHAACLSFIAGPWIVMNCSWVIWVTWVIWVILTSDSINRYFYFCFPRYSPNNPLRRHAKLDSSFYIWILREKGMKFWITGAIFIYCWLCSSSKSSFLSYLGTSYPTRIILWPT